MNFLRNLLASILGTIVAFAMVFMMFFMFIIMVESDSGKVGVLDNSVLELSLSAPVADRMPNTDQDPFSVLMDEGMGLDQIVKAINYAKNDPKIKGISIRNNFLLSGMSQAQSIRNALEEFKKSGKPIYAYGDFYTQKDYYLASVADSIVLNPVGMLEFRGLSAEVLYYKDLQEKAGVKMEVIRHGKYKSAVEPFLDNKMSPENKTQLSELLDDVWEQIRDGIARSRSLEESQVDAIAEKLLVNSPTDALEMHLVDDLLYKDQYDSLLKYRLKLPLFKNPRTVSIKKYATYANQFSLKTPDEVAVVYAQGEIMPGPGSHEYIGEKLIVEALEKAVKKTSVKAIVLRVNSPGGSSLVSENIWRAVKRAKGKKPLVVSMGNVAASGGYYIATAADKIFATPTTITGSIGVFGTIPNASELAKNMGIHSQKVSTHNNGLDYSVFAPMSSSFRNYLTKSVENTYDTFLSRVSEGRGLSLSEVDAIAQGRVWSAKKAQEVGLVDEIGDLEEATASAAELAGIDSYKVRNYPHYKSFMEQFLEDFAQTAASVKIWNKWTRLESNPWSVFEDISVSVEPQILTRIPFSLLLQ